MKYIIYFLLVVVIVGCDSNEERRKKFSERRILIDSDGDKWIVKHHMGDNYHLTKMPEK